MSWPCFVFGHQADPVGAYYGDYHCVRCGKWDTEPVLTGRFDGAFPLLREWTLPLRLWFRQRWYETLPCPACGNREHWGEWCDCLPF